MQDDAEQQTLEHLRTGLDWLAIHGWRILIIAVAVVAAWIIAGWLGKRVSRLFAKPAEGGDDASRKVGQTLGSTLCWTLRSVVIVVAGMLLLHELGVNVRPVLYRAFDWLIVQGPGIAVTLVLGFVALKVATLLASRMAALLQRGKTDAEFQKRADTLSGVVRWVLQTGIIVVTLIMLLGKVGVEIGPIIAAAGIVGLAVGFGAQNLVQDVISGFFILLEDQVRVGDVVQLDNRGGLVERITLRMVVLRDAAGSVHYVRNGKIDVVTNMTKDYSCYVFNVSVAYREDVDEVISILKRIDEELRADPQYKDDIIRPLEVMGLDEFASSALIIKARTTTKPSKQWRVGREFNRRLKMAFDQQDIEIPFPHVTVYPGKDKKGQSPPLTLEIQRGDRTSLPADG